MSRWLVACLLLVCVSDPAARPLDHVVLTSIDGLRPDAITEADAPRLYAALQRSGYSLQAENILPSLTLPNHASMLSGLSGAEHGVRWNHLRPGRFQSRTLFDVVAEQGGTSAAFVAKKKLVWLIDPARIDRLHVEPKPGEGGLLEGRSARNIAAAFREAWREHRFTFAFVHLREPDSAGHDYGWMTPRYRQAVRAADAAVGSILDAIDLSNTAVVVTADHGGIADHHRFDLPASRTIPWIAILPGMNSGVEITQPVRIQDTAPTIAAMLGYPWPETGSGRVIGVLFNGPAETIGKYPASEYRPPAPGTRPASGHPESGAASP
ncbi:MAG: alkaline phosphatase family protein [Pseudomonadota bacterium]|nr:alkaline phosphatase family protein [Pseudomonadota bacterium]